MLLVKEIKKTLFSITFVVFMTALLVMAVSQDVIDFSYDIITEPKLGEDYGIQQKEIPELIMPAAFSSLYNEFIANEYIAYPIGFYKNVKLSEADREKMAEIISVLSDVSVDDLLGYDVSSNTQDKMVITLDGSQNYAVQEDGSIIISKDDEVSEIKDNMEVTLSAEISYEEFKKCMKRADDIIGGGSNYSEDSLLRYSYVAVTYEDAVKSYQLIESADKFTGAYARFFCDYIGVILSVLPVFIAVAVCLKDRRAKMNDLIYARKTSSFRLMVSRYFAVVIAVMLPTVILAYISNSTVWGEYSGMSIDYLAPLKYTIGWLMPSVMIAAAIGMFFTELTETPIAIAIHGLWWFIDLNAGVNRLRGIHNLFELTPRHNSLRNTQIFLDEFNTLTTNRLLITGVALLFVAATVIVYEQKRRGKLGSYGKIKNYIAGMANRKSKSAS